MQRIDKLPNLWGRIGTRGKMNYRPAVGVSVALVMAVVALVTTLHEPLIDFIVFVRYAFLLLVM